MTDTTEAPIAYFMSTPNASVSAGMTISPPPRPSKEPSIPAPSATRKVMRVNQSGASCMSMSAAHHRGSVSDEQGTQAEGEGRGADLCLRGPSSQWQDFVQAVDFVHLGCAVVQAEQAQVAAFIEKAPAQEDQIRERGSRRIVR